MMPLLLPQVGQETEELAGLREKVGSLRTGPPGYSLVPVLDDHLELRNPIIGLEFDKHGPLQRY